MGRTLSHQEGIPLGNLIAIIGPSEMEKVQLQMYLVLLLTVLTRTLKLPVMRIIAAVMKS